MGLAGAGSADKDDFALVSEEAAFGEVAGRPSQQQAGRRTGYIAAGTAEAAEIVLGGKPSTAGPGSYVDPTVFDAVKPDMLIAREEICGPVQPRRRWAG